MNTRRRRIQLAGGCLVVIAATVGLLAQAVEPPESWDGLVEVKPKRMDAAFLLPGVDFRPYTRVMIDPPQVAFRKDWLRDVNRNRGLSQQVSTEDADAIMAASRANFGQEFEEAFADAGYAVAEAAGPDVLRISAAVVNLVINAPIPEKASMGRSVTLVANAGEATLILEARDSQTGALLGRMIDRRETRRSSGIATSFRNESEFRALFNEWARTATHGLEELKAHSPVPEDLKPMQKL